MSSTLKHYDRYFMNCPSLTAKSVWTINAEFINMLKQITILFVRRYEKNNKNSNVCIILVSIILIHY